MHVRKFDPQRNDFTRCVVLLDLPTSDLENFEDVGCGDWRYGLSLSIHTSDCVHILENEDGTIRGVGGVVLTVPGEDAIVWFTHTGFVPKSPIAFFKAIRQLRDEWAAYAQQHGSSGLACQVRLVDQKMISLLRRLGFESMESLGIPSGIYQIGKHKVQLLMYKLEE